jgi:hypothetical protein
VLDCPVLQLVEAQHPLQIDPQTGGRSMPCF